MRTERLRTELAQSALWHSSRHAAGAAVDWSGEDLSETQMPHAILADAVLIATCFDRSNLDGADLASSSANGASFIEASLIGATLSEGQLAESRFDRARASRAQFVKATLSRARFDEADLSCATLGRATCVQTDFSRSNLTGASFEQTNFYQADLRGTNLTEACFERTYIDLSTRFDECIGLESAKVVSIQTGGALLEGASARRWLSSRAEAPRWTLDSLQDYLSSKLSRGVALSQTSVAFEPPQAAVDFERVIGNLRINVSERGLRHLQYVLPRWPHLVLEVNADRNGALTSLELVGGSR